MKNNFKTKGEVLENVVENFKGSDIILHIGAQSGFFFVGTAEEFEKEIDDISDGFIPVLEDKIRNAQCDIELVSKATLCKRDDEDIEIFSTRLTNAAAKLRAAIRSIPETEAYIKSYTPIRKRKVKSFNKRIEENTVAIIVEGIENGDYWDRTEWDSAESHLPGKFKIAHDFAA